MHQQLSTLAGKSHGPTQSQGAKDVQVYRVPAGGKLGLLGGEEEDLRDIPLGSAVTSSRQHLWEGPAAAPLVISRRYFSTGLLFWCRSARGRGCQRKPPGVAMGKSLQHSIETWNFLLLTISYPTAISELTRAGQTLAAP